MQAAARLRTRLAHGTAGRLRAAVVSCTAAAVSTSRPRGARQNGNASLLGGAAHGSYVFWKFSRVLSSYNTLDPQIFSEIITSVASYNTRDILVMTAPMLQVQQSVLHILRSRRKGVDVPALARAVTGTKTPTRSQLESVRRSLRNLTRKKLIAATRARTVYRIVR